MADPGAASGGQLERLHRRWEIAALALLVVAGVAYYGQYYRHGFNLGDEGSLVLIADRLLAGERPYIDIDLGYGVLWYYPLMLLFKATGVSFVASRVFFCSLSFVTSVLAFLTVRRHTSSRLLPIASALVVLAVPGTLHKAYIPLIVIANMWLLPRFRGEGVGFGRAQVFGAGLVAAISYHLRPDLGLFAALVLVATVVAGSAARADTRRTRLLELSRNLALIAAATLVPTLPLLFVAHHQGFLGPYLQVLDGPFAHFRHLVNLAWQAAQDVRSSVQRTEILTAALAPSGPIEGPSVPAHAGANLARVPLSGVWARGQSRGLALLTYLPVVAPAIVAALALRAVLRRRLRLRSAWESGSLGLLGCLALAYSAFPQFFVFRPDPAHLSQFMPGYVVLAGIVIGSCLFPGSAAARLRVSQPTARALLALFLALHIGLYTSYGLGSQQAGSIALSRDRTERFRAANGVDIFVRPAEHQLFESLVRLVDEHTEPGDVVLCFPYCPGINVMADRPTFQRRLYVDDSLLIVERGWLQRMAERIAAERPPVIIVHAWAPNNTEISLFRNWAAPVMRHVESEYPRYEKLGRFEVFALAAGSAGGEATGEEG